MCPLAKLARRVETAITRAVRAAVDRLGHRLRQLWTEHLDRMADNVSYAAAAGAIVGGLLGYVPPRDVLTAVLAAALGIVVSRTYGAAALNPSIDPWDLR